MRTHPLQTFDSSYAAPILGLDEVGLGCIAGPIYAAGVILPPDTLILNTLEEMGATDSKKLTAPARKRIYDFVSKHVPIYRVEMSPSDATELTSMHLVVSRLFSRIIYSIKKEVSVATVLVDGNRRSDLRFNHRGIVKGDSKSLTIAVASIIAKVERDAVMTKLGAELPQYKWENNKGYPTKEHMNALEKYGVSPHHRKATLPIRRLLDVD
jgi:ribonuclease HII